MKRTVIKAVAVAALFGPVAWAQDQPDLEDEPGRGVARLSLINGDVSVKRGDTGDWMAGAVNTPLVVEDHVMTGPGSRAEVQFDWANSLRLAPETEVRLATLENARYQVQLATGTVMISVLRDSNADFEVDTPSVSVRPLERGRFRVAVLPGGETEVTARSGDVEIFTPTGVRRLRSGQTMLARGAAESPEYQIVSAPSRDDWDRWNEDRDRMLQNTKSYAYTSKDVYGADELDRYGRWVYVPPYGWVWSPNGVGADWAPYRDGRWAWVDYYGWTWVGYEPWGWAPYHYGRWFYGAPYGWCWYPGGIGVRHYWRPALVGFFGFGVGGVNIGIGFGNIGWVPLAPYEPYYPWYGRRLYHGYGGGYYGGIRIVHNTNIYNIYRNARVHRGITGMDYNHFGRGGRGRAFDGRDVQFHKASAVRGVLPVTPGHESLRVSDREARHVTQGRDFSSQRFYARRQPERVDRVPFENQRRGMENITRRTLGDGAVRTRGGEDRPERGQGNAVVGRGDPGNDRRAGRPEAGRESDWRRIGETQRGETDRQAVRSQVQRGNAPARVQTETRREQGAPDARDQGWQRFGGRSGEQRGNEPARVQTERPAEQPRTTRGGQGNWRRFEGRGDAGSNGEQERQRVETPRSEPRTDAPRYSRPDSRGDWSRTNGGREPVRLNPPIVRERSGGDSRGGGDRYNRSDSGRYSGGSTWSRGGGGGERYDRGSAPSGGGSWAGSRSSGGGGFSAPRSSGGGAWSGSRSSGGGFSGGGRSSGGGGMRGSSGGGSRSSGGGGGRRR